MANTIPCPNPVCTHQFTQAQLQSAAQVSCPKCGFHMAGRGAAPAKPIQVGAPFKPAPPAAKPIQVPGMKAPAAPKVAAPIAQPISAAPMPPLARPITAPVSEEPPFGNQFFNPTLGAGKGTLVKSGKSKRPFNWMRLLLNLLAIAFAVSIVAGAAFFFLPRLLGPDGIHGLSNGGGAKGNVYFGNIRGQQAAEKIYKLVLLKDEWEIDNEVKNRFGAHAAWSHKQYDFWFAVVVSDYGMSKPRDAAMLKIGVDKLEAMFGDAMELGKQAEPTRFGEFPGYKLAFKGQMKSANWLGECYMFFNNGIAYWVFIASPDWAVVEYFATVLPEQNFFVQSERRGWREQPPPLESFKSLNDRIVMTAPKGVWERSNPKNEDENGELFLFGKYLKEKDNRKNASLLIFTLPRQGDLNSALLAAREYLDKKKSANTKIAVADDKVESAPLDVGNRQGRMIDLKLLYEDEPKRFYLLGVLNEADGCYGILCECTWENRQIWRQDFVDLLRSLQIRKGE